MNGPTPPTPEYTMDDIERALFSFSREIPSSDNSVVNESVKTVDNHYNQQSFLSAEIPNPNISNNNLFVDPNLCSIQPIHRNPTSSPVTTATVPSSGYGRIIFGGYSYQSHHVVHPRNRVVVPSSFPPPQQPLLFFNPNTCSYQPSMTMTNISPVSSLKMSHRPQHAINKKKRLLNQTNLMSQPAKKKQMVSSTITRPNQKVAFYRPKSSVCSESPSKAIVDIIPPKSSLFYTLSSRVSQAYHDIFVGTPTDHSSEQLPSGNWIYQRMYSSYRAVIVFKQFIIDLVKEQIKMEHYPEEELHFNWLDVLVLRSCHFSIPHNRSDGHVPKVCKILFEPYGSELIEIPLMVDENATVISPVLMSLRNFYRVVEHLNLDQVELSLVSAWLLFGDPDGDKESLGSKQLRRMCRDVMIGLLSEHHSTTNKDKFRTMEMVLVLSEVASVASYISLSDSC